MALVPTIGRKIYYRPHPADLDHLVVLDTDQPFDVNIVYVRHDGHINIAGYDHMGVPFARQCVRLRGPLDGDALPGECEWMPYQKGRA